MRIGILSFPKRFTEDHGRNYGEDLSRNARPPGGGHRIPAGHARIRIPLWPVKTMDSRSVGIWQAVGIQVVDVHELAAGKLSALMSRRQARDLFDCSNLFRLGDKTKQRDLRKLREQELLYIDEKGLGGLRDQNNEQIEQLCA